MDVISFSTLLTPDGQEALQAAANLDPEESDFLRCHTALSRRFPAELARAAVETAIWRKAARSKFPHPERMYFTREALEQSTGQVVADYRSRRYAGCSRILDLGCSIGGDTLALARIAPTVGVDIDMLRLRIAQANLSASGLSASAQFVQADLLAALPIAAAKSPGLFFDPARRTAGKRSYSVHTYRPPLNVVFSWLDRFPALGVKISPGAALSELRPYLAEIEFISVNGELKEAVLWFGDLRTAGRRATLLPGEHTLAANAPDDPSDSVEAEIDAPRAYIYEPDPAVLRAGLVRRLAAQIDAVQLDPDIAYLTASHAAQTPFARHWQVEAWMPFNLKRLRAALNSADVNRVVVKKRGSPIEPEDLIRSLKLGHAASSAVIERTLFLTHLRGRPIVVICLPSPIGPESQPPSNAEVQDHP